MRASSTWHERSQRVGWDIFYTPLGGRLRSEKNLTVADLSDESIKRLRSQSMIAATDKDLYYCFVNLGSANQDIYVIPAKVVAKVVSESHATWLSTPGKGGKPHKDTDLRRIITEYKNMRLRSAPAGWIEQYKEKWDYFV